VDRPLLNRTHWGDVLEVLRTWPDAFVHCAVTSPPYFGLRDYDVPPSVFGGRVGCAHQFVTVLKPKGNGSFTTEDNQGPGGLEDSESNAHSATRRPQISELCGRCGAWCGQLGCEPTPEMYVDHMVEVLHEVRRVLRPDGTLWLNIGDCFASNSSEPRVQAGSDMANRATGQEAICGSTRYRSGDIKSKDLIGVPWALALALRAPWRRCVACKEVTHGARWGSVRASDGARHVCPGCLSYAGNEVAEPGWYLRSDIVWAKRNQMPESVSDRPTKSHEFVFLLAKSETYFYDNHAIKEPLALESLARYERAARHKDGFGGPKMEALKERNPQAPTGHRAPPDGKNKRDVWFISTKPYKGSHYAVFPPDLVEIPVQAGTSERGACAECGAPWTRAVVEKRDTGMVGSQNKERVYGDGRGRPDSHIAGNVPWDPKSTEHRWERPCAHPDAATVPCIVLDPFIGSGTSGLVAHRLGRDFLGIDLNEDHVKMADERVRPEVQQGRLL